MNLVGLTEEKAKNIIESIYKYKRQDKNKKLMEWIGNKFQKNDLDHVLRLIFAFFLLSETQVWEERCRELAMQFK